MKQLLLFVLSFLAITNTFAKDKNKTTPNLAPTTPMGWKSYDAYHGEITEKQFRACVDVLSEKYLPLGYQYAVVDFCGFNPGPEGWDPDNWKVSKSFRIWIVDVPNSEDKYLAMFNLDEKEQKINFSFFWEHLQGTYQVRDLWEKENMEMASDTITRVLKPHASVFLKLKKQ